MTTLPIPSSVCEPFAQNSAGFDPTAACMKCRRPLDADCVLRCDPPKSLAAIASDKFLIYCPSCVSGFRAICRIADGHRHFFRFDLLEPTDPDAHRVRHQQRASRSSEEHRLAWS